MCFSKIFFVSLGVLLFAASSAQASLLILRDANGVVLKMNLEDAKKACPVGTRLPTSRELAEESKERGAKGIWHEEREDFYQISAVNPGGEMDVFYFSYVGYDRIRAGLGANRYWSSSKNSFYSDYNYVLNGATGVVGLGFRGDSSIAVACVLEPKAP